MSCLFCITARLVGSQQHQHHNESSCSSGPDSPRHPHSHPHSLHGGGGGGGGTAGASSAGVSSVTGAMSKELPLDTSSSGGAGGGSQGRAQYLSATCVVFTNYSGDTASVVDEHFSRALNYSNKDTKGRCPGLMGPNPPSFSPLCSPSWNCLNLHADQTNRTRHVLVPAVSSRVARVCCSSCGSDSDSGVHWLT